MTQQHPHVSNAQAPSSYPAANGAAALVRLGWMLGGTTAIVAVMLSIAAYPRWAFSFRDVAFWGVVGLTLALRWLDITRFAGETASGGRATKRDFRRYAVALASLSAAGWVLVHSLHV